MKALKTNRMLISAMLIVGVLGPLAVQVAAQTAELPRRTEPFSWYSGRHDGNGGGEAELAVRDTISVPGSPWMQLRFGNGRLGKKSYVEIVSLADGATQRLDAVALKQWNNQSAFFNGDAVEVRLFVGPQGRGISIDIPEVVVGEWALGQLKSICGTDDRVASTEPRVARIDPVGCTGWIVNNGKHLTAGHCLATSGNNTLSFNPPASLPDGTVQFPGPEDQYSIDQSSFQFTNGGIGNDWGIFAVFDNSQTGLQPIEAQGSFSVRQDLGPANIRITGFGVDTGVTNQTNQTDVGPNAGSSGTIMRYVTDTRGGNSGSPVIDEATGQSVGIHTHGGCTSSGGNNYGTSFFNSALWSALDAAASGNPFLYAQSNDQKQACYGIATGNSSYCNSIVDFHDRQMCTAMANATQAPCVSMTDRDLQLSCFGMSIGWASNCRDIVDSNMKDFCYAVSTPDWPRCGEITHRDTELLCYAMSNGVSSNCRDISVYNDRQFCYGVSSGSTSYCSSITP